MAYLRMSEQVVSLVSFQPKRLHRKVSTQFQIKDDSMFGSCFSGVPSIMLRVVAMLTARSALTFEATIAACKTCL